MVRLLLGLNEEADVVDMFSEMCRRFKAINLDDDFEVITPEIMATLVAAQVQKDGFQRLYESILSLDCELESLVLEIAHLSKS